MSAKSKKTIISAGVIVAVLLAVVTAAWSYTNGVQGRLSTTETAVGSIETDIQELKTDVKDIRTQQMEMWIDLAGRKDGPPKGK